MGQIANESFGGTLVGRQALVLKSHADDRDIDARENVDGRAQCRERADD
jgi:hypothetical protein